MSVFEIPIASGVPGLGGGPCWLTAAGGGSAPGAWNTPVKDAVDEPR